MALESATYISDLVSTNPTSSDNLSQGDDHLRLLKSTIKATFPNVSGAVLPTHTELNFVDGVTSSIQTQLDAKAALASPTFTGVASVQAGSAALPALVPTGDTNTGFWFPAADTIAASTAGSERMRVDASGNVGIGTSSPASYGKFAVLASSGATGFSLATAAGNYVTSTITDSGDVSLVNFSANSTQFTIGTTSATPLRLITGNTERMRVTAAGDVGIGTATPNEKFHIRSAGSVYARIQCDDAGAGAGLYFTNTTTNWLIGAGPVSGAGEFVFHDITRSAERLRITINGGVAFGGATNYGTSGQVLQSNGDAPPSWTTPAAVTTANVLSATAGASAGAVGTYAFLRFSTLTNAAVGTTHSASGLRYSNANGSSTGGTPSGTWALMGDAGAGSTASSTSLFLRIL